MSQVGKCRPRDRTATVAGDRRRLIRLQANAERHARTRIEVSVTTEQGQAAVPVINDGAGTPPANARRSSATSTTASTPAASTQTGTSLGLAVARQTAEAHHGALYSADCAVGTCMVLLPLSIPAD